MSKKKSIKKRFNLRRSIGFILEERVVKTEKEIQERYDYVSKKHTENKLDQRRGHYDYQNEWVIIKEIELLKWVLSIDEK
jgi:hypothetical protein